MHSQDIKMKERGQYDYVCLEDGKVVICKWNDTSVVTISCNYNQVLPTAQVKIFSQKKKRR